MFPSPRSATGSTHFDTHQRSLPALPSFNEFTEGIWGCQRADITTGTEPSILPSPFTSPACSLDSPILPPVFHRRPSQDSQHQAPVPLALFPPPPAVQYVLPPLAQTPPDDHQTSAGGWKPTDDLTKIPLGWSYKEALDAITQSSFALYEFGRRFAEEYSQLQHEAPPSNDTGTYARLPSRLMVSQMQGNVAILQKKFKEVQGVVRRKEEGGYEPSAEVGGREPSAGVGVYEPSVGGASPGVGEGEAGEGRRVAAGGAAKDGSWRVRKRRKDGGDGGGVTKKPAPPLHNNKCHQLQVQDGKVTISGRCLGCDRTESTEWRRGPEGSRTLCNACGLRYAKSCARQNETVAFVVASE